MSEDIDEEHETEICKELELSREIDKKEQEEESFIFDNTFDEVINTSVRVSPDDKKITCDRGVQAFIPQSVTSDIRKWKKTSEKVRNAIATVSYRWAISVPKARVVLQAVCEIPYGHKYLLNPSTLATIPEVPETGEQFSKKVRTADDYARYKNVLPDVKPINKYKHKKHYIKRFMQQMY